MKGKFGLASVYIDNNVLVTPGAYVLVNKNNNAVYVGRADVDLNSRLKEHLPQNETSSCIKKGEATAFYFENVSSENAYILECEWYHEYKPTCNAAHPAKISRDWACPICGL